MNFIERGRTLLEPVSLVWKKAARQQIPEEANPIIANYEKHLRAYAKREGLPRDCMAMNRIEGALVTVVQDLGIDKERGDDVAFGAGVVIGHALMRMEESPAMKKAAFADPEDIQWYFDTVTKVKIGKISAWLEQEFAKRGSLRQGFQKIPVRPAEDYAAALELIKQRWPQKSTVDGL